MNQSNKNQAIRDAIRATRLKRKNQIGKSFRFKIDKSSLSRSQKESLKMFFIESKRLYNYIIGSDLDPFSINYKDVKEITYLDKDKNSIKYKIQYIGSSIIDDNITIIRDSIKGLSALKKKGYDVGGLKFKSECNSIRLRQYGVTHSIRGNRFKIQGIKKPIRVNGLKQLEKYENIEYTVAQLLYDGYDYFISLVCFIDKEKHNNSKKNIIGIDLGCESTITLSNGEKKKILIEESKRLKGLQAKLATQKKRSNNWYKTKSLIKKEYNRIVNQKNDISNKIVHEIVSNYETIIIQDDQIDEWHENKGHSKTVQHSIIGRIKNKLKRYDNVIVLDQWFPTSQHCFECGTNTKHDISKRTFMCSKCGSKSDRDIHAANNMINYYMSMQSAGTVDLKPGRKISYTSCKNLFKQEAQLSLAAE